MTNSRQPDELSRWTGTGLFLGLAAMLLFFVAGGVVSYLNISTLRRDTDLVTNTHEILSALGDVLSLAKDAETGQRGYLITGDERYLGPYDAALDQLEERIDDVERLVADDPQQQARIPTLRSRVAVKLNELAETIELRRRDGFEAAQKRVLTDRGRQTMDAIRTQVALMQQEQRARRAEGLLEMESAYRVAIISGLLTGLLGIVLSAAVAYLLRRAALSRQFQEWLQKGQIQLSKTMVGEQRMEALADNVLRGLAEYVGAQAGAMYVNDGRYRRVATYGVPADGAPEALEPGDGLLWQAVKDKRTFLVGNVPDDYLEMGSALGRSKPRHLLIAPFTEDGEANAVVELGFLEPIDPASTELLERVSESVGVAIRSVKYRAHLQNLLEETQRQSEELQAQSEELRVSNEELEEQGRALRESQTRLENQQAELEQTNAQLEEQTQLLEVQRDEAARAKDALEVQARRLEQASRYKSDFLANMSHELRTPLNSSLILAKLLADNIDGNLTPEQIQYAETIQSSGNDLLALINDILDLSKIEAGHMEVRIETVPIGELLDDLARTFRPLAEQKGLTLRAQALPGSPETLETDRQRLEQILKNLLSNAVKFTESGSVELVVSSTSGGRVSLAVSDTGIGIADDKRDVIFQAFQQLEGTTNRKYGGTGLGLSISRELVRLLGGELHVASELGKGSTFTVTLPERFDSALVRPRTKAIIGSEGADAPVEHVRAIPAVRRSEERDRPVAFVRRVDDDRDRLQSGRPVILVVEDDESFARILYDLAQELEFQCLIATTAEEGLAVARQYLPSAVVLDVGLPDNSGLSVLDRLKHDRRTRHIPVHVVSGSDYVQTALSLGAVGYLLKPVKREELVDALKQLEAKFVHGMRRVLIVEDDPVQLDSLRKLLGSHDVETIGARSAAECLERVKEETFDCMVVDLTLPDASGFSLLETLSREETYSFPPAIVYTGRDLSIDEEQRLRRYSKSIIIKGARSPERLLDEVTLFLHQVVSELPAEHQRMLEKALSRDAAIEGRRILVVEDDVRNVFAITSILEPKGAILEIARNGREALEKLDAVQSDPDRAIDLVLMDVMMPEMDGLTAIREIRKRGEWKRLPVIMLTAKAMQNDQESCLAAGANDYMAKPLDVEKLLSLIRVWMPR